MRVMAFELHPRLLAGSYGIGVISSCHVLLKDSALFPWFLIVPKVDHGEEDLHQLPLDRYDQVSRLVREVSEFASQYFRPTKLNVACIGNQVRQMHIHVVARHEGDAAWPGTVWAHSEKKPYSADEAEKIIQAARAYFNLPPQ
jgi:diadenosine tetraphosphate (Ap4A) HIT family hydrolase